MRLDANEKSKGEWRLVAILSTCAQCAEKNQIMLFEKRLRQMGAEKENKKRKVQKNENCRTYKKGYQMDHHARC